jgi:hypothetical protein
MQYENPVPAETHMKLAGIYRNTASIFQRVPAGFGGLNLRRDSHPQLFDMINTRYRYERHLNLKE